MNKKKELEDNINELKAEIEDIKKQIEYTRTIVRLLYKRGRTAPNHGKRARAIMQSLYDAHISATEKVTKVQRNISITLEKRRSLILIREKKAQEMKNDLQNLIDYIDSIAKEY